MSRVCVIRTIGIGLSVVALLASAGAVGALEHGGESEKIVVHLSQFSNDLHAVNMALKLGTALLEKGHQVTLFLDLEGVRLVDKGQPLTLRWGTTAPIGELYEAFVGAGGKVLVCPHCAAAAGIEESALREGAKMGTTDSITNVLAEANKILDF